MSAPAEQLSAASLALAFVPALAVVLILHRWTGRAREGLYGFARMLLQLVLIGYLLVYIFEARHYGLILAVLGVMVLAASWIALRTSALPKRHLYGLALVSVLLGGGSVLLFVTQVVLGLTPWYEPRYMIPLAGMIFASSMNSLSLAAERFEAEIRHGESYDRARSTAFRSALIPITNSLYAVGLVSLPGMMTGQILAGTSPLVAVRYQILVMCMMFAAAGLSGALFLHLLKARLALFEDADTKKAGD
jgi:putative ABC transport system permease protein